MSTGFDLPDDLDLAVVRRDDELLDEIARREPGFAQLGEIAGDPALTLLASLAADVDEGLEQLLAELAFDIDLLETVAEPVHVPAQAIRALSSIGPTGEPTRQTPRRAARHLGRVGVAAAVAAAVLSVSGVSAAVTGNALAPIQKVASTVAAAFGHGPNQHASDRAKLEARLREVDRLIRAGQFGAAQTLLDQINDSAAGLSSGDRRGIAQQLANAKAKLDRESAKATASKTPQGATKAPHKPTDQATSAPKPSRTTGGGSTHEPNVNSAPTPTVTPPVVTRSPKGKPTDNGGGSAKHE